MGFIRFIVTAALLFGAQTSFAADTLELDEKRTIEIIGAIDGSLLSAIQRVDTLSRGPDGGKPLYFLINSPGGDTIVGYSLVDAMEAARARGTRLVCVTGVMAASMAFNLLAHCDERYALPNTKLLFHPARILSRAGMTSKELLTYGNILTRFDRKNEAELIEMMGVSRSFFLRHYWAETLWEATDLLSLSGNRWLTIVTDVQGTSKLFVLERQRSLFDMMMERRNSRPVRVQEGGQ